MRLHVMSDLHLDFHTDGGTEFLKALDPAGADVLVLAGDTCEIARRPVLWGAFDILTEKYKDIIYVPGNHEFYGLSPPRAEAILEELVEDTPNLHWLRYDQVLTLGGYRFLGDTMWFPDVKATWSLKQCISDFSCIRHFEPWVYRQNKRFSFFLKTDLREGDIVISHHIPSEKSVHLQYQGDPTNAFFVSDQEKLILERKPRLWIHGHTHEKFDYVLGDTRIVCNPRGYPRERTSQSFNAAFYIDLP